MPYYLLPESHTVRLDALHHITKSGLHKSLDHTGILIFSNLNGCFTQFEGEYVFSNLYTVSTLVNN